MLKGLRLGIVGPSYPIPITVNRERDVVRKSPSSLIFVLDLVWDMLTKGMY